MIDAQLNAPQRPKRQMCLALKTIRLWMNLFVILTAVSVHFKNTITLKLYLSALREKKSKEKTISQLIWPHYL